MLFWLIFIFIILIIIAIVLIFYNQIKTFLERTFFSFYVGKKIYKIAKDNDFYLLNKVAINIDGKTIHFNHILFGNKYIYCIGENYYSTGINGKFDDLSWYQYRRNNKHIIIKNPMLLHRERVNYFSSIISSPSDMCVATFVVNDSCLIDEISGASDNDKLVNISKLPKLIKKFESNNEVNPIHEEMLYTLVQQIKKYCE